MDIDYTRKYIVLRTSSNKTVYAFLLKVESTSSIEFDISKFWYMYTPKDSSKYELEEENYHDKLAIEKCTIFFETKNEKEGINFLVDMYEMKNEMDIFNI